ncbi:uncharacterized protein SCHCODRAFT_02091853 [Schizophyllum commune H4-8]|uniref:uncharacterized protein n=1 Tax=Schizophyllum commune (strain H4-8 / FGSC 9210) TaxID=578458 RepID=UPI00215E0605|nr:uncharacterized protein SCHCODRAFT_02091853 [Schizophyllum commune H4-8]KAI5887241.1 hypothetical protein SCHCODRAFT_02091853 [Schizophyllum commune H4-8]
MPHRRIAHRRPCPLKRGKLLQAPWSFVLVSRPPPAPVRPSPPAPPVNSSARMRGNLGGLFYKKSCTCPVFALADAGAPEAGLGSGRNIRQSHRRSQ